MKSFKGELSSSLDSLRDFLETFDKTSKGLEIPLPKPQNESGYTKSKDISSLITIKIPSDIQLGNFFYRSKFKKKQFLLFSVKSLSYTVINSNLGKLSTLTILKFTTSTRTNFTLQADVKQMWANTICSTLTPDCRYDNSVLKIIKPVLLNKVRTKCVLVSIACTKKDFQPLSRSNYQGPQCTSTCQVRNIPKEEQTNSFFLKWDQGN